MVVSSEIGRSRLVGFGGGCGVLASFGFFRSKHTGGVSGHGGHGQAMLAERFREQAERRDQAKRTEQAKRREREN